MVSLAYPVRHRFGGNDDGAGRFGSCVENGSRRVGWGERAAAIAVGPLDLRSVCREWSGLQVVPSVCVALLHVEDVGCEPDLLTSHNGCTYDLRFEPGYNG